MPGAKTLADGRIALWALTTKPSNMATPSVQEIGAGNKISCHIMKSDYALGADSDTEITEQEMCKTGEGKAPGPTSYAGNITVFRYLDEAGKPVVADDFVWDLIRKKGTTIWLVEREGPAESKNIAEGDIVSVYEVVLGTPTKPSDRFAGYIKRTAKLNVMDAAEDVAVAAVMPA
nr:MAG TPA: major tail protein [Caudoviricetes sp.]